MFDPLPRQSLAKLFRFLNRGRTNQNRTPAPVTFLDLTDDRPPLGCFVLVDHIGQVLTDHGLMCGDYDDRQPVDFVELLSFAGGGAGHPGQFAIHAEVILNRDGSVDDVARSNGHPFLGLDGLMQAIAQLTIWHQAAGKVIHQDDAAPAHDVVPIPPVQRSSVEGLLHEMHILEVCLVVDVEDARLSLQMIETLLG